MKVAPFFGIIASLGQAVDVEFTFHHERKTMAAAEEACQSEGKTLAFFRNQAELSKFMRERPDGIGENPNGGSKNDMWLGIVKVNGNWENIDGSNAVFNWRSDQPSNLPDELCVVTNMDDMLDKTCGFEFSYSCRTKPLFGGLMKQAATWDEAQNLCLEQGGVLAYYENEAEKAEYQTATDFPARRGRTWIGVSRSWINSDGKPAYSDWAKGKSGRRKCAKYDQRSNAMVQSGCNSRLLYSCRFD